MAHPLSWLRITLGDSNTMRATATNELVDTPSARAKDKSRLHAGNEFDAGTRTVHRENGDMLHSWKEIAVYLCRDVRTAQRWEKQESLPVHRHQHRKSGSIFAFKGEVDAWQKSRSHCRQSHELQSSLAGVSLASLGSDKESGVLLYQAFETVLAQLVAQAVASTANSKVHGTHAVRRDEDPLDPCKNPVDSKEKLNGKRPESYTFLSRLQ
jgi:hypothetical protein